MSSGFLGGIFGDNSEILFFIILFLLLFWGYGGCGARRADLGKA